MYISLNDLFRRKAEFIMHRVRQNFYYNRPRPSKLLALQLRQSESRAIMDTIYSPSKGLVTNPREIITPSQIILKIFISQRTA